MNADLGDLTAFLAIAKARGFRDAARTSGTSASTLSETVRHARVGTRRLTHPRQPVIRAAQ